MSWHIIQVPLFLDPHSLSRLIPLSAFSALPMLSSLSFRLVTWSTDSSYRSHTALTSMCLFSASPSMTASGALRPVRSVFAPGGVSPAGRSPAPTSPVLATKV